MPGGLVRHYQHQRDHTPDPERRRDAERVLEDLRSLCRAAQAYEEHDEHATLTGFLEHAAGLHAQEVDAATDRRITVSTIHRAKGTEAQAVALLGCEEQLLPSWRSLSSPDPERLAEERRLFYVAATRAKDRLLITHVAERGRRPDRRPLPVPRRGRAPPDAPARSPPEQQPTPPAAPARRAATATARTRSARPQPTHKETHVQQHQHQRRTRPRAPTPRRRPCSAGRSRPARSASAR